MTSLSKRQQRVAFANEASTQFETLYVKNDIMSLVVAIVARNNSKSFSLDSSSSFIYQDFIEMHDVNRRKSTRQFLMKVKSDKTLNIRQDILIDRVNHLHIENMSLQYRLESLKKSVKYELASKDDVIKLNDEMSMVQNTLQNALAKIMTRFDKIDDSTGSTSQLVISEKSSEKAFLRIDFALQSPLISHSFSILSARNAFSIQNARNQLSHRWNDDFNDRIQRFHRDDYELNRERSRSRLRDTSHEFSATNSKSTYLQSTSIAIKQEEFKTSNIDYFYSDLSKKTYVSDDYVVLEKIIFYRDVYMFTQQVKRVAVVKHEDIRNKLHLCLREAFMIWFTSLDVVTRNQLIENLHTFFEILIRKYKLSNFKAFDKLIAKHCFVQDARKQRFVDESMQAIMRHEKACNIVDEATVKFAWKNLDVALRKNIRRLEKHVIANDFVELLNEVIEYYDNLNKKHDEKKVAYQRNLKTTKKCLQSQSQQRQKRNQVLSSFQTTNREFQSFRQYSLASSNQKLLTNNAKTRNAYFAEKRDNASSEDEIYYSFSAEIKYSTAKYAQFDDIAIAFHAQISIEKDFHSEINSRNEMSLYFCNICQINYLDDYRDLDNHMYDIHQIDINSNAFIKRKRYVNWIKHAVLNVYEIKVSSNDYITFQEKLFDNEAKEIFVCADIEFEVSFMNESLLSQDINLFEPLIFTLLVTIRDISDERIVDKQIHLFIHVKSSDDVKIIEITSYVAKRIKVRVILVINVLEKSQNKITWYLHTKKMQMRSSHVPLNFMSSETMLVSFNVAITALRSHMKATTSQTTKKTIKFAKISEKTILLSVKLITISGLSHRERIANNELLNANWHRKCAFVNVFAKTTHCLEKITKTLEWRRLVALSMISARSTRRRANKSYISSKSRRRLNQLWR